MKFGFVTCVQLGLDCMEEIYSVGGRLELVITLKDQIAREKSGRIYVDNFCNKNRIDVLKIQNINDEVVIHALQNYQIDWLFVIGWSQIVKLPILRIPLKGVLGMHPTLLPIGRGRAAIPWAILKGLRETGVTLFVLDEGVDTGPILAQKRILILPGENATTLYEKVCLAHRALIRETWSGLKDNQIIPIPQNSLLATEWPGRTPADGRINLTMSVSEVDRLVRATTRPYPGSFWVDRGKIIRIWSGRINNSEKPSQEGTIRLFLKDGIYDVLDYVVEY